MPDDYGYPAGAKQRSDYEPFRLVNVWKKVGGEKKGGCVRASVPYPRPALSTRSVEL